MRCDPASPQPGLEHLGVDDPAAAEPAGDARAVAPFFYLFVQKRLKKAIAGFDTFHLPRIDHQWVDCILLKSITEGGIHRLLESRFGEVAARRPAAGAPIARLGAA